MEDLKVYHNSHDLFYRNPFGAVTCGQKVVLRLETQSGCPVKECFLRLWEKGEKERLLPMKCCQKAEEEDLIREFFETEYTAPNYPGLVWYYFIIKNGNKTYYYGNSEKLLGGQGQLRENEPPSYQLTVYLPSHRTPEWFKKGIMYQIFVDRFFNGSENGLVLNPKRRSLIHGDWYDTPFYLKDEAGQVIRWDFFGGNLIGVLKKLPYLRELGISVIYFNPIFESPSNHKYDTADYLKIDPMFGDEKIFERLVKEAEKNGISIILDGVFSHTGSDSVYFNKDGNYPSLGAFQSPESPYFKWYRFIDYPEKYECWWGVDVLPNVNEIEPSYREFIYEGENSVVRYWLKKGVKGWRLDVADELPDEFIKGVRRAMTEIDSDSVLIGEVWEDASNKISYGKLREYLWGEELDSTMNYPFRSIFLDFILGRIDALSVQHRVMSLYENYPREHFFSAMNIIGSHDTIRILTLLGEAPPEESLSEKERENFRLSPSAKELAVKRLKLLSLIQMTFPGVPCIYYGDEAGVEGYSDPYNRGTYPWGREDGEILDWYKKIIKIRREYEVLHKGQFESFPLGEDIYGFRRLGENEEIIVVINRSLSFEREVTLKLPAGFGQRNRNERETGQAGKSSWLILELLSGNDVGCGAITELSFKLKPLEGKLFYCKLKDTPMAEKLSRSCGVLLHITSLPSRWGIGDMGENAFKFADFLENSGQNLWQVLPLNPVGPGFSPYQSDSAFAGNPLLISIDSLIKEGLLKKEEAEEELKTFEPYFRESRVNFPAVEELKGKLLRRAFDAFKIKINKEHNGFAEKVQEGYTSLQNYRQFQDENKYWLDDYCLYKALKQHYRGLPWNEWEKGAAFRGKGTLEKYREALADEIEYNRFLQYTFYYQWKNLKKYINSKGISVVGDMPLYVSADSCDTWVNRELFELDDEGRPLKVAGVPPDYFSKTGQLWGNPLYNWEKMAERNFSWWKERIRHALKLADYIRLDHFRGFEAYWEIPGEEKTAVNGRWIKGPGKKFFEEIANELGRIPIIAEDLGVITPEVKILKEIFGLPGMKVLQFLTAERIAGSGETENTVYYTGTHDNDTLMGWYKKNILAGCRNQDIDSETVCRELIEILYRSSSAWVIIPLQDILGLDSEARMNIPGTAEGNWEWRMKEGSLTGEISSWLQKISYRYGRNYRKKEKYRLNMGNTLISQTE